MLRSIQRIIKAFEELDAEIAALGGQHGVPRPYSQRDGERPTACGRAKYLRAHRSRLRAGDPESWSEGRSRLMSAAAWGRFIAGEAQPHRLKLVEPTPSPSDRVLAALGGRRT